jgi:hypothetical protein
MKCLKEGDGMPSFFIPKKKKNKKPSNINDLNRLNALLNPSGVGGDMMFCGQVSSSTPTIMPPLPPPPSSSEVSNLSNIVVSTDAQGNQQNITIPIQLQLFFDIIKIESPSISSLSILILSSSMLKNRIKYLKFRNDIFQYYQIDDINLTIDMIIDILIKQDFNYISWIFGRVLLSDIYMNELINANIISAIISKLVLHSNSTFNNKSSFVAWSMGYNAIHHVKLDSYSLICNEMIQYTVDLTNNEDEKGNDNITWCIILNLQSLAMNKKKDIYNDQLLLLQKFTNTDSVLNALLAIPADDYRAWGISLVMSAAYEIEDSQLFNLLSDNVNKEIDISPSKEDQLLALLVVKNIPPPFTEPNRGI